MSVIAEIPVYRRRAGRSPAALLPTGDPVAGVTERVFAEQVAKRVHGPVLRYSDRLFLLRAAHRLHIERFRANLIIALVQREAQPKAAVSEVVIPMAKRSGVLWTVGVVLLIEAMAVASGYAVWRLF